MELKIPPPIIFLLVAAAMWLIFSLGLVATIAVPSMIALVVFLLGVAIGIVATMSFSKAQTTIDPRNPQETSQLVDTGIFGLSRNPMYLSLTLELCGVVLYLGDPLNIVLLLGFVVYINKFQIIPEERALKQKFPQAFAAYQAKVRRWI
ncbi:MAG: protein-S-isoprenylcysteine O-methyltransferase Ste14 [Phenylobacterium sp.]|jgi:protein-S-isoprenylcysteine O-methyltransferase Ste14